MSDNSGTRNYPPISRSHRTVGRENIIRHLEAFRGQVDSYIYVLPASVVGVSTTRVLDQAVELSRSIDELRNTVMRTILEENVRSRVTHSRDTGPSRNSTAPPVTHSSRSWPSQEQVNRLGRGMESLSVQTSANPSVNRTPRGLRVRPSNASRPVPDGFPSSSRRPIGFLTNEGPPEVNQGQTSNPVRIAVRPDPTPRLHGREVVEAARRFTPTATPRVRSILRLPSLGVIPDSDPNDDTWSLSELEMVDPETGEPTSPSLLGRFGFANVPEQRKEE